MSFKLIQNVCVFKKKKLDRGLQLSQYEDIVLLFCAQQNSRMTLQCAKSNLAFIGQVGKTVLYDTSKLCRQ